ncbi:MAG TPA: aldehyde dehydrogenase family protein [Thermoanaerobaculia bacterium]|nr:aldehyde dehydrogenase family protein [Thermoanaerobaculia bacterium]
MTVATSRPALDRAVDDLQARKAAWPAVGVPERLALLAELRRSFLPVAERWAAAASAGAGLEPGSSPTGVEWLMGPTLVLRNLRLLARSLAEIARHGRPRIPGGVWTRPDGRAVAGIVPLDVWDRLLYNGIRAEVWMQPGVTAERVPETQAVAYHASERPGGVALVLGAGNVSSIGPMDALYKLFVENRVVVYKTNPANAYLGALLEEGFGPLVARGFFRLAHGGAEEGAYLCQHSGVEEIHITGSDRTYEAIVFGAGEEGRERKRRGAPRLAKPVTSELGNVSPAIVVPGPWSDADFAYQAEYLATMLATNAGFNCNALRVVVQHGGWSGRERLLDAIRAVFARTPARRAWYPGAADRWQAFLAVHPDAERFGAEGEGRLPWTLIPDLDPGRGDEICFTTEAFCGVAGETALPAADPVEYLERAVAFCNERLWGTLNATVIVHPRTLADPAMAAAFDRAVAGLRYGTVSLNHWAAVGYALVAPPWGAYPGHTAADIQSGTGVVHNTLMFSRVEKSVVRGPFRAFPKPPWLLSHRRQHELFPRLTRFEAAPSPLQLPGIFAAALRG